MWVGGAGWLTPHRARLITPNRGSRTVGLLDYDKGRDDARDNRAFDPMRQDRYRSADRGYNKRYGSKEEYRAVYRDGFRAGYEEGYGDVNGYGGDRRGGERRGGGAIGDVIRRLPWPLPY